MNLKWKKKYLGPILGLVGAVVLIGGVYLYSSSNIQPDHQKEFNQTSKKVTKPKEKAIDLSGDYVSNERDEAKIEKKGKAWKIDYQTADGKVSAEFSTDWKVEGSNKVSTGKMKKSDGNTDFTVTVRVFKYKTDKKPLITVTMSDKNPDHEMVFANREDFSNRQIPMMSSLMAISHRLKVLIPMIPMKRKSQIPVLNFMAILQKNITKTRPTPFQVL